MWGNEDSAASLCHPTPMPNGAFQRGLGMSQVGGFLQEETVFPPRALQPLRVHRLSAPRVGAGSPISTPSSPKSLLLPSSSSHNLTVGSPESPLSSLGHPTPTRAKALARNEQILEKGRKTLKRRTYSISRAQRRQWISPNKRKLGQNKMHSKSLLSKAAGNVLLSHR